MQLGNVCIQLKEYQNAKKHYEQSIKDNPSYALVYCKLGILLSDELNEFELAQQMFAKCVKLQPKNNDLCWFRYGKLMYKVRNFDEAKHCYLQCNEMACVHYHFAKLLLTDSENNNIDTTHKAKLKLEKAIQIKPNNGLYHYEYALCLLKLNEHKSANEQFIFALKLTNESNLKIKILFDYAMLLYTHFNNHSLALQHLKTACDLDTDNKFPHIKNKYLELQNGVNNVQIKNELTEPKPFDHQIEYDSHIQLMVYGFETNITYWPINDIPMEELQSMSNLDMTMSIFGGTRRLTRIQYHFERILSKHNAQLAIISQTKSEKLLYVLKEMNLFEYFADSEIICATNDILQQQMVTLAEKYKLNITTDVLFIDSDLKHIELLKQTCKTYAITSEHILNGLSLLHMRQIETIVGVANTNSDHFVMDTQSSQSGFDMRKCNNLMYESIKKEIGQSRKNRSINSLPSVRYIRQNWPNSLDKDKFLYFAAKYQIIRHSKFKYDCWTGANILPGMMLLAPTDYWFLSKYATCLAGLKHYDSAEYYFELSLTKQPRLSVNYMQYAYFLFNQKRYTEAETLFQRAMVHSHKDYYSRACLGYARTLECLNQLPKAEIYYQKAVKTEYQRGKMEYFYGIFLFNHSRYSQAKIQFRIALKYSPNSDTNHYWLSKTLLELNEFESAEHHRRQAFNINPYFDTNYLPNSQPSAPKKYTPNKYVPQNDKCTAESNMFETEQKSSVSNRYCNKYIPHTRRTKGGKPILTGYIGQINASDMERHRESMRIIAQNEYRIRLEKLPLAYLHYFGHRLKNVYRGKMKDLAMYFSNIFELKYDQRINKVCLISKVYSQTTKVKSDHTTEHTYNPRPVRPKTPQGSTEYVSKKVHYNPCSHFSEPIDTAKMECHRDKVRVIAENVSRFHLSQFHIHYWKYFRQPLKCVYQGKAKNIVMYFNDLFDLEWNQSRNATYVISKIYSKSKPASEHTNGNDSQNIICEKYQIEFDRFWLDELGIVTAQFNEYYDRFLDHSMKDIRCIFEEDIQSKLQRIIKVDSLQDLQLIMTNVRKMKKENTEFKNVLETKKFELYYPMFTHNAIFTIPALKYHIQSETDLKQMIERYIAENNSDKYFNDRDEFTAFIFGILNK